MTAADLFPILCETTVAGSAAILLVLALRKPLRHAFGAGIAYAAWALGPLAMLAVLLPAAQSPVLVVPVIAMQAPGDVLVGTGGPRATPDLATWAVMFVGCGALASMCWMAVQQRRFVRGLGLLADRGDGVFVAQATEGLPAVIGLLRPRIVLPADAMHRYDAAQRDLMLAHERAHIARGDLVANAIAAALRCLFWFNPLVHFAATRFRHDQELACDAQVVRQHPDARRAYGEAMLKTQLARGLLPLGCHWGQTHPLRERIEMLKQPLHSMRRRALGRATAVALLLATGYAAWAAQPSQPSITTVPAGKIAADIALRVDEGEPVRLRAVVDAGVPFSLSGDEGGKHYAIEGSVTRMQHAGQPALALDLRIVEGSRQDAGPKLVREIASPKIVVSSGKSAQIHVGEEVADPAGRTTFKGVRLDIVLTDSMPVAVAVAKRVAMPASTTAAKPKPITAKLAMAATTTGRFNTYERMLTSLSASWQPPKPVEEGC
ncbi:M56 family metallopeptidase [Thermomonas carbonis]|uniref:M56 family metallopeptidase n=1 Tax=Thermomonas carbonis TaxID=1463158 RepID=A0A7G9SRH8_9GAMM|nr:M56 family metallopeptidase [Thermomonas carbonis]QNN70453.1 M56 family metallopeptidase [Thermomonas carbonis]